MKTLVEIRASPDKSATLGPTKPVEQFQLLEFGKLAERKLVPISVNGFDGIAGELRASLMDVSLWNEFDCNTARLAFLQQVFLGQANDDRCQLLVHIEAKLVCCNVIRFSGWLYGAIDVGMWIGATDVVAAVNAIGVIVHCRAKPYGTPEGRKNVQHTIGVGGKIIDGVVANRDNEVCHAVALSHPVQEASSNFLRAASVSASPTARTENRTASVTPLWRGTLKRCLCAADGNPHSLLLQQRETSGGQPANHRLTKLGSAALDCIAAAPAGTIARGFG